MQLYNKISSVWPLFLEIEMGLAFHLAVYEEQVNWFIAQWKCSERGGWLVSPNNTDIQQQIMEVANFR